MCRGLGVGCSMRVLMKRHLHIERESAYDLLILHASWDQRLFVVCVVLFF